MRELDSVAAQVAQADAASAEPTLAGRVQGFLERYFGLLAAIAEGRHPELIVFSDVLSLGEPQRSAIALAQLRAQYERAQVVFPLTGEVTLQVLDTGPVRGEWLLPAGAGHAVVLIGRAPHVEAIRRDGLRVESRAGSETVRLEADTGIAAVRGADLVLFCVKSPDTDAVARAMAPHLEANALVLSLQNGVDNAATIARQVRQVVVPAVVYVATAMPQPGVVQHFGRGDLVIGPLDARGAADAGGHPGRGHARRGRGRRALHPGSSAGRSPGR